jgi:hypothetical protein
VPEGVGTISFGEHPRVAVSAAGVAGVAFDSIAGPALSFGTGSETEWTFDTVEPTGAFSGRSPAFDGQGEPWISYGDQLLGDLKLAHRTAGVWSTEIVDSDGDVGATSCLAMDADDRPHVVYWDATNTRLKYAHQDGAAWQMETIPTGADVPGPQASLRLDASGTPHVAYYDATRGDLEYAVRRSGQWHFATLDSLGDVGFEPSLFIDGGGQVHVAYGDRTNHRVKYARRFLAVDVAGGRPRAGNSLGAPLPNPSPAGLATFALRLDGVGAAALRVYDPRGRLVAGRSLTGLAPGENRVRWDTGIRTPGLYFVRLETPAGATPARRWVVAP